MIRVCLLREKKAPVGFVMSGHAEKGEPGEDLVCAGVSAIVQTAILGITQVLNLQAAVSIDPEGETRCVLSKDTPPESARQAALLLDTMTAGLRAIEGAYPGTLKFDSKEV